MNIACANMNMARQMMNNACASMNMAAQSINNLVATMLQGEMGAPRTSCPLPDKSGR
jgi:hypothetical protein